LGCAGDDRGEVGGGEPQVFAEEGAGDVAGGGFLAQPGFAYPKPLGGLGWGVEE
jgi:hypothetical protein